jgi:hypothetical protein
MGIVSEMGKFVNWGISHMEVSALNFIINGIVRKEEYK